MKGEHKAGVIAAQVLVLCLALCTLAFSLWYRSSLRLDLVVQRERYYKHFYITELVLNYGLSFIKTNYGLFYDQSPLKFDLSDLIRPLGGNEAHLSIDAREEGLLVTAELKDEECILHRQSCIITPNKRIKNYSLSSSI